MIMMNNVRGCGGGKKKRKEKNKKKTETEGGLYRVLWHCRAYCWRSAVISVAAKGLNIAERS